MRALRGVVELARVAEQVYLIAPDAAGMTNPLARSLHRFANVSVLVGYQVVEIVGATGVEQVVVEHDGERSWLQVDAAFADLGLLPNSGVVRQLARVNIDGFIMVDDEWGSDQLNWREQIKRVLNQVGGNKAAAAKQLGMSRRSLYRWLDRLGIPQ